MINLYFWTIIAGACFSGFLSLLGMHLAARDRSLQSFGISQSSVVGVLLGLGVQQWPTAWAMGCACFFFFFSEWLSRRFEMLKQFLFATLFIVLLAASYLISVAFPALESHMATLFFGDLATLSAGASKWVAVMGLVLGMILSVFWRPISAQSFETAIFGEKTAMRLAQKGWHYLFLLVTISGVSISVYYLGFLFTVAFLYLPATLLGLFKTMGLRRYFIWGVISAILSVVIGFSVSLIALNLPTVPTIIGCYVVVAIGGCFFVRK